LSYRTIACLVVIIFTQKYYFLSLYFTFFVFKYEKTMNQINNKILVTGATGMVGAHLLWHLLKKGAFVRATKRGKSSLAQVELVFNFMAIR
jgi:FlaA1/EpsC-like NDP-sugar epimerase